MQDEKYNWEEITEDLYSKIEVTGGKLFSKISHGFKTRNWIDNIWIEIYMNDFDYIDPFYGPSNANNNFETSFEIYDLVSELKFDSILELENFEFNGDGKYITGVFSNSLDLCVTKLKFGKIKDWKIDMHIEYSFANSSSYGNMTGTVKDHLTKSAHISTQLQIRELELECLNEHNPYEQAKYINWQVYDPKSVKPVPDLKFSSEHSKRYLVPYRDLEERYTIGNPFPFAHEGDSKTVKNVRWKFWK